MAKKKKKKGKRRSLGVRDRAALKLAENKELLASLEPGGTKERPLEVPSASVVELRAQDLGCVHCDSPPRVDSQEILRFEDSTIRCVHMTCPRCGAGRSVWVRILARTLN